MSVTPSTQPLLSNKLSAGLGIVSPSLLVSLTATPWLLTIMGLQAASGLLQQVGLTSEEIFRGDRLPILHLPNEAS